MSVQHLSFCSYNIKHYNSAEKKTIIELFEDNSFILLQETWWNAIEFVRQVREDFKDIGIECISANKMDISDINQGRPHGGVSICHRSNVKCKTETIPTFSRCICAKIITIEDMRILYVLCH